MIYNSYKHKICLLLSLLAIFIANNCVAAEYTDVEPLAPAPYSHQDVYKFLLAEIAWQRNQHNVAVDHYVSLAEKFDHLELAKRATEVALMIDSFDYALRASKRWSTLDPTNVHAQAISIILLIKVERIDEAFPFYENLFLAENNSTKGFDILDGQLETTKDKTDFLILNKKLHRKYPHEPLAQLFLALSAEQAGDHALTQQVIDKMLTHNPSWHEAITLKVRLLAKKQGPQEAVNYLTALLETHPQLTKVRWTYGVLLYKMGNLDKAAKAFIYISNDLDHRQSALEFLAKIKIEQQRYEDAKNYLMQLLKQDPQNDTAYFYLGKIAEKTNQSDLAIAWYSRVATGDYFIPAHLQKARIVAKNGDLPSALSSLQALMLSLPYQQKEIQLVIIELLVLAQELEHAMLIADLLKQHWPTDIDVLNAHSFVATRMNKINVAISDLRQILRLDPNSAEALNALGYTLLVYHQNYDEAQQLIQRAYILDPNNPAIIDSLGWLQFNLKQYPKSVITLEKAYQRDNNAEIAAHFSEALWMNGQKQQARTIIHQGLRDNPNDKVLLEVRDRLEGKK